MPVENGEEILSILKNIEKKYDREEIATIKTVQVSQGKEITEIKNNINKLIDNLDKKNENVNDKLSHRVSWPTIVPIFMIIIGLCYFMFDGINNNRVYIDNRIQSVEKIMDNSIFKIEDSIRKNSLNLEKIREDIKDLK